MRWRPRDRLKRVVIGGPALTDGTGCALHVAHPSARVAGDDAPLIGARAETRGRSATKGGRTAWSCCDDANEKCVRLAHERGEPLNCCSCGGAFGRTRASRRACASDGSSCCCEDERNGRCTNRNLHLRAGALNSVFPTVIDAGCLEEGGSRTDDSLT